MTRIQNQTGPEEELSNGAGRASLPGQTAAAAHRVVRPAPAQPLPGLPAASRGSVLAQAGATLGIALSGISRNKARTTLTLLGIVIGVASVITAVGIGTGQAAQVNAQISSLGTNLVTVQPGASFSGGVRGGVGSANTLTQSDVDALAAQIGPGGGLPDVASIAPEDTTSVQAVAGTNNTATQADGVTPEILTARNSQVAVGRFISANDVQRSAQVAVLGATLAGELFPGGLANAIGATIQLNGQAYQVIGVLALKGGFGSTDTNVFVPITAVQNRLSLRSGAANTVTAINLVATSADKTDVAQVEVEALLRRLHKLTPTQQDDFSFFSQTQVQQTASTVTGALTVLLSAIAAVSLLVAGIGIMNIMLVTVTERTREIGLRKALGSRKGDILAQFLTESTLISALGGLIGVLLSYGLAWALPLLTANATQPLISGGTVAMAVGVSLVIGLFFGSYPASRAAALDPIQALRYE
jgi:putative ABC transport system permease protein